jgi:hypothetical protein
MIVTPAFRGSTWTVSVQQRDNPHSMLRAWGKFALESDAHQYAEQVREQHPTWEVLVYYSR